MPPVMWLALGTEARTGESQASHVLAHAASHQVAQACEVPIFSRLCTYGEAQRIDRSLEGQGVAEHQALDEQFQGTSLDDIEQTVVELFVQD
jgi:hypothetical protein